MWIFCEGNMLCEGPLDEGCKQRGASTLNELRSRNYVIGIANTTVSGGIKPSIFQLRSSYVFRRILFPSHFQQRVPFLNEFNAFEGNGKFLVLERKELIEYELD